MKVGVALGKCVVLGRTGLGVMVGVVLGMGFGLGGIGLGVRVGVVLGMGFGLCGMGLGLGACVCTACSSLCWGPFKSTSRNGFLRFHSLLGWLACCPGGCEIQRSTTPP